MKSRSIPNRVLRLFAWCLLAAARIAVVAHRVVGAIAGLGVGMGRLVIIGRSSAPAVDDKAKAHHNSDRNQEIERAIPPF